MPRMFPSVHSISPRLLIDGLVGMELSVAIWPRKLELSWILLVNGSNCVHTISPKSLIAGVSILFGKLNEYGDTCSAQVPGVCPKLIAADMRKQTTTTSMHTKYALSFI